MTTICNDTLAQFSGGTEHYYRHGLMRSIVYTDGCAYVAEVGGAHWLLDEIATTQLLRRVRAQPFQVWTLTLNKTGHGARLTCEDGNGNKVYSKRIPYTDFPRREGITLWFTGGTIMLPSEY